ncbi:hypothetical protein GCM10010358_21170 [Streptomyces minutiscleroticus]|uniref:AB hydrolase-1 domain-containing protein n=1 Tax=Streptomyces minutiscleroticus TaxID=68238 RepID=A0A918KK83_9ACTN|nr:alpha/beta fold hydrolase [Streptomyces minutiscleroticus]GGX66476.1 hypothetical protein GCM10010358_21170 [Streptomyces minutiscleroticus]
MSSSERAEHRVRADGTGTAERRARGDGTGSAVRQVRRDRLGPGTTVRSVRVGTGGGPQVVLLPGLGAVGYLMRTADACAARGGTLRLLDVPGFGDRAAPPFPATIEALADVTADWLATVPEGPVVLAGHSTGAQIALHAALRVPDRVRALVLLGLTFPPAARDAGALLGAFTRTALHEAPSVLPHVLPYYARGGPRRLARLVRSAQRDAPERLLPAVSCATVVVGGRHDAIAPPAWIGHAARRAPRGRALVLPGAHSFPFTQPARTAEVLVRAGLRT